MSAGSMAAPAPAVAPAVARRWRWCGSSQGVWCVHLAQRRPTKKARATSRRVRRGEPEKDSGAAASRNLAAPCVRQTFAVRPAFAAGPTIAARLTLAARKVDNTSMRSGSPLALTLAMCCVSLAAHDAALASPDARVSPSVWRDTRGLGAWWRSLAGVARDFAGRAVDARPASVGPAVAFRRPPRAERLSVAPPSDAPEARGSLRRFDAFLGRSCNLPPPETRGIVVGPRAPRPRR